MSVNPRIADVMSGEEGARLADLQEVVGATVRLERDGSITPGAHRLRAEGESASASPGAPSPPARNRRRASSRST